jgi:uncharacterized protein YecE (DUF72 family)
VNPIFRVGTSGWICKDWVGSFYPETLKASDLLPYYSHRFNTVEVNTTFYRFPPTPLVKGWIRKSPEDFLFSIKASRYFTHLKRLRVNDTEFQKRFEDFLTRLAPMGKKLGPILFQLPPHFEMNFENLEPFLAFLPQTHRFVIEFRNTDWFQPETYSLLRKYRVAMAIVSAPGLPYVPIVTSTFAYFRLHGASQWYNYHYSFDELKDVALKMVEFGKQNDVEEVFAYFDNDVEGHAIENARMLNEILQTISPISSQ